MHLVDVGSRCIYIHARRRDIERARATPTPNRHTPGSLEGRFGHTDHRNVTLESREKVLPQTRLGPQHDISVHDDFPRSDRKCFQQLENTRQLTSIKLTGDIRLRIGSQPCIYVNRLGIRIRIDTYGDCGRPSIVLVIHIKGGYKPCLVCARRHESIWHATCP